MKRQLSAPSYIPPPSPEVLLRSTVWLESMDEEIIDYIASLAEEKVFDSGDTIVRQGDKTDGMYLIITGLVKVCLECIIIILLYYSSSVVSLVNRANLQIYHILNPNNALRHANARLTRKLIAVLMTSRSHLYDHISSCAGGFAGNFAANTFCSGTFAVFGVTSEVRETLSLYP